MIPCIVTPSPSYAARLRAGPTVHRYDPMRGRARCGIELGGQDTILRDDALIVTCRRCRNLATFVARPRVARPQIHDFDDDVLWAPADIVALRAALGFTQEQLGALVGVTGEAVGYWESMANFPSLARARRLAHLAHQEGLR